MMRPMSFGKWIVNITVFTTLFFIAPFGFAGPRADDNTAKDNPHVIHLYDKVSMISTLKYAYGKPKIFIKAVYPTLIQDDDAIHLSEDEDTHDRDMSPNGSDMDESSADNDLDDGVTHLNEQVTALIQSEITAFRDLVKQNTGVQNRLPAKMVKNNLYIDYDTSLILSGDEHIISLRFGLQRFLAGMAHPYHFYHVLNYNIDGDASIQLADLFIPGSPYLNTLSNYTRQVLNKRLQDKQMIAQGSAPTPQNFSIWNLKPDGILITFYQGQVAPYADGAQTVLVPYSALTNVLSQTAPIISCITHPKRCARYNLLTGGFIDEAANVIIQPLRELSMDSQLKA